MLLLEMGSSDRCPPFRGSRVLPGFQLLVVWCLSSLACGRAVSEAHILTLSAPPSPPLPHCGCESPLAPSFRDP